VRYLKETGIWGPAHDAFQTRAIKRQKELQAGWARMMSGSAKSAKPEDVAKMWEAERQRIIGTL